MIFAVKRILIASTVFLITTAGAWADTYPKSTFSYQPDTDYAGGDLRVIFETTQAYCETACFAEKGCSAITYNTRNGSCFLKDDSYQSAPFIGAISARLIDTDPAKVAIGNIRLKRLNYLTEYEKTRALAFRRDVARAIGTLKSYPGKLNTEEVNGFTALFQSAAHDGNSNAWLYIPQELKSRSKKLPPVLSRLRYYNFAYAVNAFLDANDTETAPALREIIKGVTRDYGRGSDIVSATRHLH